MTKGEKKNTRVIRCQGGGTIHPRKGKGKKNSSDGDYAGCVPWPGRQGREDEARSKTRVKRMSDMAV